MAEIYYCNECMNFFGKDEVGFKREYHPEIGGNFYETFLVCPHCGSDDYEDAYECEICGEPTLTEICDECKHEVLDAISKFVEAQVTEHKCDKSVIVSLLDTWLDENY